LWGVKVKTVIELTNTFLLHSRARGRSVAPTLGVMPDFSFCDGR
jgi:hypothetical protein